MKRPSCITFKKVKNSLLRSNTIPLNEAELAMFTFIQTNKRKGERTTMKKIEEQFSAKPFGGTWPLSNVSQPSLRDGERLNAGMMATYWKIAYWKTLSGTPMASQT